MPLLSRGPRGASSPRTAPGLHRRSACRGQSPRSSLPRSRQGCSSRPPRISPVGAGCSAAPGAVRLGMPPRVRAAPRRRRPPNRSGRSRALRARRRGRPRRERAPTRRRRSRPLPVACGRSPSVRRWIPRARTWCRRGPGRDPLRRRCGARRYSSSRRSVARPGPCGASSTSGRLCPRRRAGDRGVPRRWVLQVPGRPSSAARERRSSKARAGRGGHR